MTGILADTTVAGLVVFAIQLALIVGLLMQRSLRRRAEEDARRSDARYRGVVDTRSDLVCRFLPDTTLTFVNDAYCRFWNATPHELIGQRFIELVPSSARHAVLTRIAQLDRGTDSFEYPVTLRDGDTGWHHWILHAMLDERGRVIELQGVGRDITVRKRAEDALGQLEARHRAILRAIPDVIFVFRCDGTFVDYHARDPTLLFAPPEAFLGNTIHDVMPRGLARILMDALHRACQSHAPVVVEYEVDAGEVRAYEARFVRAGPDRVVSIVRDVTESKQAIALNRDLAGRLIASQEAERARIARDLHDDACQEVAGVAMEISNVLHRGESRACDIEDALTRIHARVAGIAESLRQLTHDLHPTVLQYIGLVPALESHCVDVERQYDLQVAFFAQGDVEPADPEVALSLFRITQEALRNAAKHGQARHAAVDLVRSNGHLRLSITDDGMGFDLAVARDRGGLGLVNMEERARLAAGQVSIFSEPRQGTRIEVRVPMTSTEDAPAAVGAASARV
jgi:PAS domain S-box-containing protein